MSSFIESLFNVFGGGFLAGGAVVCFALGAASVFGVAFALAGGFGSVVLEAAQRMKLDARGIRCLGIPDRYIKHNSRAGQLAEVGIDADGIAAAMAELAEGDFFATKNTCRDGRRHGGQKLTKSTKEV